MMPTPDERADNRAVFVETQEDQAEILRTTRAASTTQPGRRTGTATVVHTYTCKVGAAPTKQYKGQNQIVAEAEWVILLPANADVLDSDTIRVTSGETGEQKTYNIVQVGRKSGELTRIVYCKGVGTGA